MAPRILRSFLRFLKAEATGGLVLVFTTVAALALSNSRLATPFSQLWLWTVPLPLAEHPMHLRELVNDGLMALFFLLVGLEIKRELIAGELASPRRAALPVVAALGGMLMPALLYLGIVFSTGGLAVVRGWAIPTATDIAFTVGVMTLLGRRAPLGVRAFVTALAIADDLGAVLIIALFYSAQLHLVYLGGVVATTLVLVLLNKCRVRWLWPYLFVGAVLWLLMLRSGIHATIAGVVLGMCVPLRLPAISDDDAPLARLSHALAYPVSLFILPLFALANAGVPLPDLSSLSHLQPETIAVFCGLFFGKPLGISLFAIVVVRLGWGELPAHTTKSLLIGASMLCGIGFTMSIFIAELAFGAGSPHLDSAKLGILSGSFLSALCGALFLRLLPRLRKQTGE